MDQGRNRDIGAEIDALVARGPQVARDIPRVADLVHHTLVSQYWVRYKSATRQMANVDEPTWATIVANSAESGATIRFVKDRWGEIFEAWLRGRMADWIEQNKVDAFAAMTEARCSASGGEADGER